MASKLNFRARTLDAAKPMSIYFAEDLPELSSDLNAINRSVPAMPSGMEKEEEAEKHLQDILELQEKPERSGEIKELVIPTPEVFVTDNHEGEYQQLYKGNFKLPRQFIHVQPFSVDQDKPDYDMDDEDQEFLDKVLRDQKKFEVNEITFEDMLDRLEKNSGHNVVSVKEAKLLLKEDDELILAVYDYWVDKRLRLKQPLIPTVKSDKRDGAAPTTSAANSSGSSNPYIAFRRRTEKMQTRKNRKNDETSYEKMLKLRRELTRAVTLLEMAKRREKTKKEYLNLTKDIFEKRYTAGDFDGKVIAEVLFKQAQAQRALQASLRYDDNWLNSQQQAQYHPGNVEGYRKKRSYIKKKKHKSQKSNGPDLSSLMNASSDDDFSASGASPSDMEEDELEGQFAFRRKRNCQYLAPLIDEYGVEPPRGWPWDSLQDGGTAEAKYRYSLAFLSTPRPRCVGMIRRRVGRGGRIVLDRAYGNYHDLWKSLDFMATNGCRKNGGVENPFEDWPHYRPVTPLTCREEPDFDPYKPRLSEPTVGLPTHPIKPMLTTHRSRSMNGLGMRTLSMDSANAHSAATAVVSHEVFENER